MTYLPLDGVKVLDLSRLVPGAVCTRALAGFGAEVVKVEPPGIGDNIRVTPPFWRGQSIWHLLLNRGKRSIALDLKTDEGRETLLRLAAVADVVVEVSRPGRFQAMGIDWADLRRQRPEIVICSITGFGQTGPLAPLPAHGLNMEALSGMLPVDHRDGRPVFGEMRNSGGMGVELAGLHAALGVMAALVRARATGEGAWIDASCWDAAVEVKRLSLALATLRQDGGDGDVEPWALGPLYDLYESADGRVLQFCAIERKFWQAFCDGVGRADLAARWSSDADYWFGDDELRPDLEDLFRTRTADDWFDDFVRWGVPATPVLQLEDLVDHPHMVARGLLDPAGDDELPGVNGPVRWADDGSRPGQGAPPPPPVGADTDDVLARWLTP